jgi:hypothetical protein
MRSISGHLRLATLAFPVLVVAGSTARCTPIVSEQIFLNQARGSLQTHFEQNLATDWTPSSDVTLLYLDQGETVDLEVSTAAGQRAGVLGSCDDDCVDLNIEIFDTDGFRVAYDAQEADAAKYPFARFTAGDSSTHRVRFGMAECRSEPCYVAYWVVRDRSASGQVVSGLYDHYRLTMAADWETSSIIQTANLGEEARYAITRVFEGGRMAGVIAVCDTNCANLDIQVFDADGFRVAYEQQADDMESRPFASFPVERTGSYRVEFGMAECRRDPCSFAYMLMQEATN